MLSLSAADRTTGETGRSCNVWVVAELAKQDARRRRVSSPGVEALRQAQGKRARRFELPTSSLGSGSERHVKLVMVKRCDSWIPAGTNSVRHCWQAWAVAVNDGHLARVAQDALVTCSPETAPSDPVVTPQELAARRRDPDQRVRAELHVLALPLEVDRNGRGVARHRAAGIAAAGPVLNRAILSTGRCGDSTRRGVIDRSLCQFGNRR